MNISGENRRNVLIKRTFVKSQGRPTYSEDPDEQALYECMANIFEGPTGKRKSKGQQVTQEQKREKGTC